ncbi:glycosyltransferase, partial [Aeromicrobium sp.]|uniref:arsenate reductase/protein-tyrosine-phosphatase family protein n=1 Tax=Aeromicrobium sp. TaxID=1871063 RepID=UPI0019B490A6
LVCSGNICRSPGDARLLQSRSLAGAVVHAESAGTGALVGESIHPQMVDVMRASGIEVAEFAARQLTPHMIQAADLVLTMTREQRATVLRLDPRALAKTFTLKESAALVVSASSFTSAKSLATRRPYIDLDPSDYDIDDPYGRRDSAFREAFASIEEAIDVLCDGTATETAPGDSASPSDAALDRMTVLESFPEPRPTTNPYVVMLKGALERTSGVTVSTFSWRTALTGDYDVFHVHWPEILVTGRGRLRTWGRQRAFSVLLRRLRRRGVPIIRTMHNLGQHEEVGGTRTRLLKRLEAGVALRILINESAPPASDVPSVVVPHGHYRDWYEVSTTPAIPGRVAFFGLIRPYKAVDSLIRAFSSMDDDREISLHIAGKPSSDELADALQALASQDPRIRLSLTFLSDDELVEHVSEASLVVLPYQEMHNSGGVLAALSLNRPVLVPRNEINGALAQEVGPGWVHMYDGDLSGDDIERAMARSDTNGMSPDLSLRDWDQTGIEHKRAFQIALEQRG